MHCLMQKYSIFLAKCILAIKLPPLSMCPSCVISFTKKRNGVTCLTLKPKIKVKLKVKMISPKIYSKKQCKESEDSSKLSEAPNPHTHLLHEISFLLSRFGSWHPFIRISLSLLQTHLQLSPL